MWWGWACGFELLGISWVVVKVFNLIYQIIRKPYFFTVDPYYGNLIESLNKKPIRGLLAVV